MDTGKESGAASAAAAAGLRGVVAAQSKIGDVNGESGVLIYQGYDIHDLAEHSTFEEVVFLLWNGRLPKKDELDALESELRANYEVPAEVDRADEAASRRKPIRWTCCGRRVSSLDFYDKDGHGTDRENAMQAAIKLTAPDRHDRRGLGQHPQRQRTVAPETDLNIAENFLYMLRGEMPDADEAHMFDVCLILHADHELNASTFTTRVVAGTLADMYGAVTAGIAALAGPLHGGANTNVMKMLHRDRRSRQGRRAGSTRLSKQNARSWASATRFIRPKTRVRPGCANIRSTWPRRKARRNGSRCRSGSKS